MTTKDADRLLYRTEVITLPSGARFIVTIGPEGVREAHLETPYREGDIYDRLLDRACPDQRDGQ